MSLSQAGEIRYNEERSLMGKVHAFMMKVNNGKRQENNCKSFVIKTYGCQMNEHDSEKLAAAPG